MNSTVATVASSAASRRLCEREVTKTTVATTASLLCCLKQRGLILDRLLVAISAPAAKGGSTPDVNCHSARMPIWVRRGWGLKADEHRPRIGIHHQGISAFQRKTKIISSVFANLCQMWMPLNSPERCFSSRFRLTSSQSGTLVSVNDMVAVVLVLFVGYLGEKISKPRQFSPALLLHSLTRLHPVHRTLAISQDQPCSLDKYGHPVLQQTPTKSRFVRNILVFPEILIPGTVRKCSTTQQNFATRKQSVFFLTNQKRITENAMRPHVSQQ